MGHTNVTDLELAVILRVEEGVDPWPFRSRRTSQALGRLQRKGLITHIHGTYTLTLSGREALTSERGVGGRLSAAMKKRSGL
jgi:DNA-binding PadR family transcriptional regulator